MEASFRDQIDPVRKITYFKRLAVFKAAFAETGQPARQGHGFQIAQLRKCMIADRGDAV